MANVDLYMSGFPCQPFSLAGYQQGFKDEKGRGTIVNYVLEYIEKKRPNIFILENVKGFTVLDGGKYVKQVVQTLKEIKDNGSTSAYIVHHKVINTNDHGVPQHREDGIALDS